jgi:hypothetical protein
MAHPKMMCCEKSNLLQQRKLSLNGFSAKSRQRQIKLHLPCVVTHVSWINPLVSSIATFIHRYLSKLTDMWFSVLIVFIVELLR